MEILENVSNHLWKYKNERGLSIDRLAEELNIGRSTISKCLHKTWNPTLSTLSHLAQQMNIPLGELILSPGQHRTQQEEAKDYLLQLKRLLEDVE